MLLCFGIIVLVCWEVLCVLRDLRVDFGRWVEKWVESVGGSIGGEVWGKAVVLNFFVFWGLVLCWEVLWFWIVFGISAWDLGGALCFAGFKG